MLQLLLFWAVLLWFGLHFWVIGDNKNRIAEIALGVAYLAGGSVIIATADSALAAACGAFAIIIGVYFVSGASSELCDL